MEHGTGCLHVYNTGDIDRYMGQVRAAAAKIPKWISAQDGDPLDLMRRMKFETGGFHPKRGIPIQVMVNAQTVHMGFKVPISRLSRS